MGEHFQPYERSQIWLGESAARAVYDEESRAIASRLYDLKEEEIYVIAADATEGDRVRWEATLRLPRERAQQLADELLQREEDYWWASMVRLCAPSRNSVVMHSLRKQLTSPSRGCRVRAMQLLARMGDDSVLPRVHEMLDSKYDLDRLVAVTCLQAYGSEDSKATLRRYVAHEPNPIATRVRAADALLRLGERGFADVLIDIATMHQSSSAYNAACGILHHLDKRRGFELFAHILAQADHPAASVTVMHVTRLMGNHELGFESSGLDVSRLWLASQLAKDE